MDTNIIYKKVEDFVTGLFEKQANSKLLFHNLKHTETVVQRTKEIAAHYNLNEKEMLVLYVAAWFHDVGHLFTPGLKNHEDKSVDVMKKFMSDYDDKELTAEIEGCILSTKMPRNPLTLTQQIICDADTYHFGTKDFKNTNKLMREEYNLREEKISKEDWNEGTLEMLNTHQFYTAYCKDVLDENKKNNIKMIKKKLKKYEDQKDDLKLSDANSLTSKGIQTMLRLTSENHLKLSDMADHKANILISVNAIIISVILGVLMRKLEEEPALTIPTIIFLLVSVTTIVISILATRPKVSGGTFTEQDIMDKKTNLLFFGNFYKAPLEQYDTAMRKMMKDPDYLYGSLIKDIYMLAVVLGRKYRLIRIAYYIFMVGIVVSVAAFAIAVLFFDKSQSSAGVFPL
jgi:predicted metal-dependent HD superfamily phosphohydrolase